MTLTGNWRFLILRFYWDHEETPAIECPAGDFFCCGWGKYAQLSSLPVCVNPGSAFNCYWEMPFHSHARITLENCSEEDIVAYYQINCSLGDVPADGISRFRTISRPLHTGIRIDPLTHRIRFRRKICLKSFDSKA